ncbi:MAG TPA: glycosyltransferase family 4 protein [Terriglobales bacterium]|nr:glycosyltransferase family 4 protein [Terriglobales bacterium]
MRDKGPPRVLHIVPALFGAKGVLGGAERYALELAQHMADVVPTRLFTFGDADRAERVGNLDVRVVGNPWHVQGSRSNPFAFALFAEASRADVIHCHQQHILASSMAAAFANLASKKIFVTDLGGGGWDVSAYISTDRWYRGHLHISDYSRSVFNQEGKSWSHVILGGVDTKKFSPDATVARGSFALFVGRLLPHKGINYLVEAMPQDMPLEVIGQPMRDEFFRDLQKLASGKMVAFHHDCTDYDITQAYRSALCIVLPSVYRNLYGEETKVPELLGQTLLEGMACGTPAICTDVASMPEVVEDGVSGFVVPPNNPIALGERLNWLRNHPSEAAAMGRAARERVLTKFTWPAVVQRCLEIYAH